MRELALHLLDIAENSVSAGAQNICITVVENTPTDQLTMSVSDDGKGMDADTVARVVDPFVTSRTTRKVGLGIPLLKAAAEACNGSLSLHSELGKGTHLEVSFQRSHIDRMPLGDLPSTIQSLVVAFPEIHWVFRFQANNSEFVFDDVEMKQELEGISLTEPPVLAYIRTTLEDGVANTRKEAGLTA